MASKILLLDGNSLIHRAYHALPHLSTTTGQPTNAAFGFVQMVLPLLLSERPDVAVLALDAPGPTFRHDLDERYKANRPEMEEDLVSQLAVIRQLAEAMGFVLAELPGFEADDLIGSLVAKATEQGAEVLMVSGDRDLAQLVGPRVRLLAPVKGFSDTRIYDEQTVRTEFGVPPSVLPDLKGLAGDSSDNIKGVPDVGPKTARDLLARFGTLEQLYEHLHEVERDRIRQRLAAHEEEARLGKRLATIATDAPVPSNLLETPWPGLDVPRLRKLLAQLEFTSLLGRLPEEDRETTQTKPASTPDPADVESVCAEGRRAGVVGLALSLEGDVPTGIAVACETGAATWCGMEAPGVQGRLVTDNERGHLPECVRALLADPGVSKVGHDLKALARSLDARSVTVAGLGFDTAVAAYLLAPHRGAGSVDTLAAQYFGEALPAQQNDGSGARARAQAVACLRLREPLLMDLDRAGQRSLFEDVELPLVPILLDMERAGIALDTQRLDEIGDKLSGMLTALEQRIFRLAGTEFNLDSPKQVAEVLFERLQLPRGRRTKTGWSTNAEVLEELAPDHEIVALILTHREYSKLKSTYVDGLMRLVSPEDGRVHTTFEQTVVATGRLSSRNPNLQNIPVRTEWGREIRSCFVAGAPDAALLSADYSQIELRILAHFSQDPGLLEAFRAGQDIHTRTAAAIFGTEMDAVTPDMRRMAKTVNYAVIYGMGSVALAKQLGCDRTQAQKFIENYFQRLPGVKAFMEAVVERARRDGYVTTLFGRRRALPDLQSKDARARAYAERAAGNTPLQGTASDIIKRAMVRLGRELPAAVPRCRMLLQVHDELVFEVTRDQLDNAAALVREVMESAAKLDVPLEVEVKAGSNWRDMTAVG